MELVSLAFGEMCNRLIKNEKCPKCMIVFNILACDYHSVNDF